MALAMPCSVAVNEEEGPDFFDSYAKNTNGLTGIYSYTVEPAEDCGISIVLYGTRMQLDLDVTELVDGEEEVHLGEAENMEYYFGARSFDPGSLRQGSVAWMVNAGLVAHAWGDQLEGMCVGEQRRLLIPPSVTYGQWKGKAIYIDFELIKVDDKGFKEWELEERKEMLTTFYKTYDPSKSAAKISELVEKAGLEKFPKLCRQLYAKYNAHPVTVWLDDREAKGEL